MVLFVGCAFFFGDPGGLLFWPMIEVPLGLLGMIVGFVCRGLKKVERMAFKALQSVRVGSGERAELFFKSSLSGFSDDDLPDGSGVDLLWAGFLRNGATEYRGRVDG